MVQLVADQHVSDGSMTKEENTRRINQLAEKLKIVLAMSDDAMGPCEINSKAKGKVEFFPFHARLNITCSLLTQDLFTNIGEIVHRVYPCDTQ